MDIKKIAVICIAWIAMSVISVLPIVCVEAASQDAASASQVNKALRIGMPKKDLLKIYSMLDPGPIPVGNSKGMAVLFPDYGGLNGCCTLFIDMFFWKGKFFHEDKWSLIRTGSPVSIAMGTITCGVKGSLNSHQYF